MEIPPPLIGRTTEKQVLQEALTASKAELIAITGRRRVGKTFLIQQFCQDHIAFEITGIFNANLKEQLLNFRQRLTQYWQKIDENIEPSTPKNWLTAFITLTTYLEKKQRSSPKKLVVFFDELPWLASRRSGFLKGFSFFWNSWAVRQQIVVVVCGSATSWMNRKFINNEKDLYNRITQELHLAPFNLAETAHFLKSRGIQLDYYHMLQLYMVLGGVPHYLEKVKQGKSATQNIEEICFSKTGILRNEFEKLYHALFENADQHIAIIRALATKWKGLTRQEIIKTSKVSTNGHTTKILKELIDSGFISSYAPFNKKKKQMLYRLTDEYSLFYLKFMEHTAWQGTGTWQRLSQTANYQSWAGYAFESICWKHVAQIKKALGIHGIYCKVASFFFSGNATWPGTQIDLLIERNDRVINICEAKFYNKTFTITKEYVKKLKQKKDVFEEVTKTKKQVMLSFISTYGIHKNQHSLGLVDNSLTMEVLFQMVD